MLSKSFSPDLLESMRQAELCDWAMDPVLFTSLCDSLNRFFTQRGMITSGSNSPLALGARHSLQVPQYTTNPPPTLASLTHPSPLPYPHVAPSAGGAQPPRRPLPMQDQAFQRPPLAQPGKFFRFSTFIKHVFNTFIFCLAQQIPTAVKYWIHVSVSAGLQPQFMAPRQRPPLKSLHSNSEEIQDDFDWDSLLIWPSLSMQQNDSSRTFQAVHHSLQSWSFFENKFGIKFFYIRLNSWFFFFPPSLKFICWNFCLAYPYPGNCLQGVFLIFG